MSSALNGHPSSAPDATVNTGIDVPYRAKERGVVRDVDDVDGLATQFWHTTQQRCARSHRWHAPVE